MINNKPYKEEIISENVVIRTFPADIDKYELVWHQDLEDRLIESLHQTDWMFQLDNELPFKINGSILIPKYEFHRLIKGTGDLRIKITKNVNI